ncbi:hypothetical protein SAMN05421819_1358 [Bryocella elongata]|uniref:Uncharacterized protein n=1 Tax=Bryocella elongata TaxID=863522 RepID=A0A1H5VXM7_9BACT|nr:hypothetical protein [Bryocella elongata]SEF91970.1 hypothetical protein SAMN05421819_1358 [Bryocella elongata]
MTQTTRYWAAGLFRGTAAVLAGTGTLFLPSIASTAMGSSTQLSTSTVSLASFLVIDASIVAATAWRAGGSRHQRVVLRGQAVLGGVVAASLVTMLATHVSTGWLLGIAAVPALASAMTALATAACPSDKHRASGCYLSAAISLVAAAILLGSAWLGHGFAAWSINLYLCLVGAELIVLSGSMLASQDGSLATEADPVPSI